MKKKIKRIVIILLILYGIFIIYKTIKLPFPIGGYYIVNFDNKDKILEQSDKELIVNIIFPSLDKEQFDKMEITKLAYQDPFRHEGVSYIFYRMDGGGEIIYEHICLGTGICEEYIAVQKVVDKYYKWWENNEKSIDYKEKEREAERDRIINEYYQNKMEGIQ